LITSCFVAQIIALRSLCVYRKDAWFQQNKKLMCCGARFVKIKTAWETLSIRTNYSRGNSKIEAISFDRQTLNYIPVGIDRIFPNLKELFTQDCNVLRLEQKNFKSFPKLEALSIRGNLHLDTLERGLFDYNKKLKYINLYCNNFKHIDPDLVSGLSSLKYFELEYVACLNITIKGTSTAPLRENFQIHCQDSAILQHHIDLVLRQNLHEAINNSMIQLREAANQHESRAILFSRLSTDIHNLLIKLD